MALGFCAIRRSARSRPDVYSESAEGYKNRCKRKQSLFVRELTTTSSPVDVECSKALKRMNYRYADEPPSPPAAYDSDSSTTSSSGDSQQGDAAADYFTYQAPRPVTPPKEVVTCMWNNCGLQYNDLQPLISHVHGTRPFVSETRSFSPSLLRGAHRSPQIDLHL